jgi:hypothetical protein
VLAALLFGGLLVWRRASPNSRPSAERVVGEQDLARRGLAKNIAAHAKEPHRNISHWRFAWRARKYAFANSSCIALGWPRLLALQKELKSENILPRAIPSSEGNIIHINILDAAACLSENMYQHLYTAAYRQHGCSRANLGIGAVQTRSESGNAYFLVHRLVCSRTTSLYIAAYESQRIAVVGRKQHPSKKKKTLGDQPQQKRWRKRGSGRGRLVLAARHVRIKKCIMVGRCQA